MSDTRAQGESVATAIHPRDASDWQRLRRTRNRWRFTRRRGLSTAWLLLFGPVFLVLLGLVVEIGNIYVAQSQLENAMEAAALAAVKEWGGSAPSNDWTLIPRQVGAAYGNVNEVAGQRLGDFSPMGLNYQPGGTSNNNASCGGDLVFGAVSFEEPFEFEANVEPECTFQANFGTASLRWAVDTRDCQIFGTWGCNNAFRIEWLDQGPAQLPAGWYIKRVRIRTQATNVLDSGEFDFAPDAPPPNSEDYTNDPTREGWGPFYNAGASTGISTAPMFFQGVNGNLPINSMGQSNTLTLVFADNDFVQGSEVVFGVDTDKIGVNTTGNIDTSDSGTAFKDADSAFVVDYTFSNGTYEATVSIPASDDGVKKQGQYTTWIPPGQAVSRPIEINIPGTGNFAVLAQRTITVPSLCGGILGIASSFNVYAQSTAMWRCDVNDVSLIRLNSFQCSD